MGLSGRKVKQRIGHDPRNLSWADDANKFGAAYLSKLGWASGTGLGTTGEGRTTHIKVHQKLDMLGIGAAHQKDPNGIAWKQNKDFENLLRRLNAGGENGEEEEGSGTRVDGFARAKEEGEVEVRMEVDVEVSEESGDEVEIKEKKRKRPKEDGAEGEKRKKKKSKKDAKDSEQSEKSSKKKRKEKKNKEDDKEDGDKADEGPSPSQSAAEEPPKPIVRHPHRAHRARYIASKRLAYTSSKAVDEILGISRSGTSTPYPATSTPETPSESPNELKLQELTTSSKSVMDYFKEKLAAKSNKSSASSTPDVSREDSVVPSRREDEFGDEDERPRGGLGSGAFRPAPGIGSRLRMETTFEEVDEEVRTGLGAISKFQSMFSGVTSFAGSSGQTEEIGATVVEEEEETQASRKEKKEKKKDMKGRKDLERVDEDAKREKKEKRKDKKGKRKVKETGVVVENSLTFDGAPADRPDDLRDELAKREEGDNEAGVKVEGTERRKRKKDKDKRRSKAVEA